VESYFDITILLPDTDSIHTQASIVMSVEISKPVWSASAIVNDCEELSSKSMLDASNAISVENTAVFTFVKSLSFEVSSKRELLSFQYPTRLSSSPTNSTSLLLFISVGVLTSLHTLASSIFPSIY